MVSSAEKTYRRVRNKWHQLEPEERGEIIEEVSSKLSAARNPQTSENGCAKKNEAQEIA